jgi:hypothetical protein
MFDVGDYCCVSSILTKDISQEKEIKWKHEKIVGMLGVVEICGRRVS